MSHKSGAGAAAPPGQTDDVDDVFTGLDIDLAAESNLLNADTQRRLDQLLRTGAGAAGGDSASHERLLLVNPVLLGERIDQALQQRNLRSLASAAGGGDAEGGDGNSPAALAAFLALATQQRVRNLLEEAVAVAKHRTGLSHDVFLDTNNDPNSGWRPAGDGHDSKVEAAMVLVSEPQHLLEAYERDSKHAERLALEEQALSALGVAPGAGGPADGRAAGTETDAASGERAGAAAAAAAAASTLGTAVGGVAPVGATDHASAQSTALMALGGVKTWMLGGMGETGRQLKRRTQDDLSRGKASTGLSGGPGGGPGSRAGPNIVRAVSGSAAGVPEAKVGVPLTLADAKLAIRRGLPEDERRHVTARDVLLVLERERGRVSEAVMAKWWAHVRYGGARAVSSRASSDVFIGGRTRKR